MDQWDSGSLSGKATSNVDALKRGAVVVVVRSAHARRAAVPVTSTEHAVSVIARVIVRIASVYWTCSCTPT